MRKIQLKDAKAKLSTVVDDAVRASPRSSPPWQTGGGAPVLRGMGAIVGVPSSGDCSCQRRLGKMTCRTVRRRRCAMRGCERPFPRRHHILSVGAPSKRGPSLSSLSGWNRNSERLYVSVVTITEIEDGIAKSRRGGATRKAARLHEWLETLVHLYSPRILPLTSLRRGSLEPYRIGHEASAHGRVRGSGDRRRSPGTQPHDPYAQHQALHPTRARST